MSPHLRRDVESALSLTDLAVLGLLAERPSHGFALAKLLDSSGPVGRVLTVRRPLVYRALDRLVDQGDAEAITIEAGDAGPDRVVHQVTAAGRQRLSAWLEAPVAHVRDIRLGLLLKLTLLERARRSPRALIVRQRRALRPMLTALEEAAANSGDIVERWRLHNARAAAAFLDDLADLRGVASRSTPVSD